MRQFIFKILSLFVLLLSVSWFAHSQDYEACIAIIVGLSSYIASELSYHKWLRAKNEDKKLTIIEAKNFSICHLLRNIDNDTHKIKFLAVTAESARIHENDAIKRAFDNLKYNTEVKFLLLSDKANKAINLRHNESKSRTPNDIRRGIELSTNYLKKIKDSTDMPNFSLRLYNVSTVFRVHIIGDFAYVAYYPPNGSSSIVPVIKISSKHWLYDAFEKYFNEMWNDSKRAIF